MSIVDAASLVDHVDEATFLWLQRRDALHAPHYAPSQFADLDEQVDAQIDALRILPEQGWRACDGARQSAGPEELFVCGAVALATGASGTCWDDLLGVVDPENVGGLASALAWAGPTRSTALARGLMADPSPLRRHIGLTALAVQRIDPEQALNTALDREAGLAHLRGLRAAGELGRGDLLPLIHVAIGATKAGLRFWGAWSAVLLGERNVSLRALCDLALHVGPFQRAALRSALFVTGVQQGHDLLKQLDGLPDARRLRIFGSGLLGNPHYAPWLIDQMSHPATARIAGEAFVHITGADFNLNQLEAMPPDDFEDGPTDDPDDEDVELPEDIALPWPDVARVKGWWMEHRSEFTPGQKLFLGKPITPEHCIHVLKTGYQRQRVIAAHYRSLIQPGTVLFPTSAPAWRQQKLLDGL